MPVPAAVPRDLSYAPFRGSDAGCRRPADTRATAFPAVAAPVPEHLRLEWRAARSSNPVSGRGPVPGRARRDQRSLGRWPPGWSRARHSRCSRANAGAGRAFDSWTRCWSCATRARSRRWRPDYDSSWSPAGCLGRSPSTGVNALRAGGWTVLRFGAADVYRRPRHVIATVRAALTTPTPGW